MAGWMMGDETRYGRIESWRSEDTATFGGYKVLLNRKSASFRCGNRGKFFCPYGAAT